MGVELSDSSQGVERPRLLIFVVAYHAERTIVDVRARQLGSILHRRRMSPEL